MNNDLTALRPFKNFISILLIACLLIAMQFAALQPVHAASGVTDTTDSYLSTNLNPMLDDEDEVMILHEDSGTRVPPFMSAGGLNMHAMTKLYDVSGPAFAGFGAFFGSMIFHLHSSLE